MAPSSRNSTSDGALAVGMASPVVVGFCVLLKARAVPAGAKAHQPGSAMPGNGRFQPAFGEGRGGIACCKTVQMHQKGVCRLFRAAVWCIGVRWRWRNGAALLHLPVRHAACQRWFVTAGVDNRHVPMGAPHARFAMLREAAAAMAVAPGAGFLLLPAADAVPAACVLRQSRPVGLASALVAAGFGRRIVAAGCKLARTPGWLRNFCKKIR